MSTQLCPDVRDSEFPRVFDPRKGALNSRKIARSRLALTAKRALDIAFSAVFLALISPLLALIALLVKLQDGGPVIYRRRVVGPKGEFNAFKFRSMRVNAEAVLRQNAAMQQEFERNFKLVNDPRITRIGAFLRKLSLDELPQLVNVLAGQMSLVGPRMITAPELAKYGEFQAALLTVKPGLTGFWQVHGRQRVAYEERVRMDIFYIENWSFWLDLRLLALTPLRVLMGIGAY